MNIPRPWLHLAADLLGAVGPDGASDHAEVRHAGLPAVEGLERCGGREGRGEPRVKGPRRREVKRCGEGSHSATEIYPTGPPNTCHANLYSRILFTDSRLVTYTAKLAVFVTG